MPSSFFGWVGFLAKQYGGLFLRGTVNTLLIAVTGTILGFLLGLLWPSRAPFSWVRRRPRGSGFR